MAVELETIVSLCKRRGFIFQSSEIYGGLGGAWDYGPLGVELKKNLKCAWWRDNVYARDDMEGLDAAILMHPRVWEASGHVAGFTDPLVDCKQCKKRFRADHVSGPGCPECGGELTEPRAVQFDVQDLSSARWSERSGPCLPAAGDGTGDFRQLSRTCSTRRAAKLPFGIAQIGKAFRNEITPRHFTFRTREFEQMEIEYFVPPASADEWFDYWVKERYRWYLKYGMRPDHLRLRQHGPEELAHYARATYDVEYRFPMGWLELEGIAHRGDFDLKAHAQASGRNLTYFDDRTRERYFPYVIEPSAGVDRAALAFLVDAYREEEVRGRRRVVLRLHPALAPIKVAVLPLLRNRAEVVELARKLYADLRRRFPADYNDTGAIGKLYARQDEVGTPFCVTVDVQTLEDHQVTVRDRDTTEQVRLALDQVVAYLQDKLAVD
ncbi:MAG: glycine--tRNA ligase [Candidatus Tectimicrobiota bacterium]|nr:MAG: glycine--tRNA ligase [Candidatus Tectomicrobia bacterium]